MSSGLYDIHNNQPTAVSKAHQQRSCVACGLPVVDHQAESIDIGGGLQVMVHKTCLSELTEAMEPKSVVIPVKQPSHTPVRKSTVATSTYDKESLKERIRYEFSLLLLKHGFLTQ